MRDGFKKCYSFLMGRVKCLFESTAIARVVVPSMYPCRDAMILSDDLSDVLHVVAKIVSKGGRCYSIGLCQGIAARQAKENCSEDGSRMSMRDNCVEE